MAPGEAASLRCLSGPCLSALPSSHFVACQTPNRGHPPQEESTFDTVVKRAPRSGRAGRGPERALGVGMRVGCLDCTRAVQTSQRLGTGQPLRLTRRAVEGLRRTQRWVVGADRPAIRHRAHAWGTGLPACAPSHAKLISNSACVHNHSCLQADLLPPGIPLRNSRKAPEAQSSSNWD